MKAINIIFVIIFMAMLLVPTVFMDFSGGKHSFQENRVLATHPVIDGNTKLKDFIAQFNTWFYDNIGFRELFIHAYNKLSKVCRIGGYFLDGSSIVIIGKEGHDFHTHYNQILPIYQGKPWLDEKRLSDLAINLNNIEQYLSEKDIPFIFMLATDKKSIYPEYYSDYVIRGQGMSSLDKVVQYLDEKANFDFFCIKDRLLAKKEEYLLYPKTGDIYALCHYNATGSFFAYQELMEHVKTYFPNIEPLSTDDVTITYMKNGSSNVALKNTPNYTQIEPRFFKDAAEANAVPLEFENINSSLPTILLIRDSYSDFFPNYLPEHFGRTIIHHVNTAEHLEEYINLYKPDIVVFESAERAIPSFASAVKRITLKESTP